MAVILPIEFRLSAPSQLEVILAQEFLRMVETGIVREQAIAAQIAQIQVLPEDPDRYLFDDQLQHVAGSFELLDSLLQLPRLLG